MPDDLTDGDDVGVPGEQPIPIGILRVRCGDQRQRLGREAGLPGIAHRVQSREVHRIAGAAVGVCEDMVGFGRVHPVGRVHGATAVVRVVRESVGEHVADRDEDAAGDRSATAVRAEEPVAEEDLGARLIGDATRGAGFVARLLRRGA